MSYDDLRAYLKPAGTNPEIDSAFYELTSHEHIDGWWNCESLTLGFRPGGFIKDLLFRPIDPTKPIVFAIDAISGDPYFVIVDAHLPAASAPKKGRKSATASKPIKDEGMLNFKPFKTDDFIVDCGGYDTLRSKRPYWAIKAGGETFVYSEDPYLGVWQLSSLEPLCAFVGAGMTANQLRAYAYRQQQEARKEESRQGHIQRLAYDLHKCSGLLHESNLEHIALWRQNNSLRASLRRLVDRKWLPFIGRGRIQALLDSAAA